MLLLNKHGGHQWNQHNTSQVMGLLSALSWIFIANCRVIISHKFNKFNGEISSAKANRSIALNLTIHCFEPAQKTWTTKSGPYSAICACLSIPNSHLGCTALTQVESCEWTVAISSEQVIATHCTFPLHWTSAVARSIPDLSIHIYISLYLRRKE